MCSHRLFHSQLCYLEENRLVFQMDRFMFLSYKEFEVNSDLSGNLYGRFIYSYELFLLLWKSFEERRFGGAPSA